MTKLRKAAQMALDAMQAALSDDQPYLLPCRDAITALRDALAEATCQESRQVEPVAWRTFDGEGGYDYRSYDDNENYRDDYIRQNGEKYANWVDPLYTDPPHRPVELVHGTKFWLWKNFEDGRPEYWAFDNAFPDHLDCGDPQTIGEPCGYALFKPSRKGRDASDDEILSRIRAAATPQRQPLTDEEIGILALEAGRTEYDFARAIERAHGIGGDE
jgi:hypothetical protein